MLAVSNTSPISNLAHIGRLDLLKSQVSVVWIPTEVSAELSAHPYPAALARINRAIHDQWIQVKPPSESPLKAMLLQQLHRGEAEAIALAIDLHADIILIDELEGRALAGQAGLSVSGTLGVLLRAKFSGKIAAVKPEIDLLRSKAHFFLSTALETKVLIAAGEK